jgi:hypothetical protein
MGSQQFKGVFSKLARASELTSILESEFDKHTSMSSVKTESDFERDGRRWMLRASSDGELPAIFAVMTGEIVHHLASSLDHLFAALVNSNGREVRRDHYFPVYVNYADYVARVEKRSLLEGLPEHVVSKIKELQPFTSNTPKDTVLAAVKELNNQDKHRLLVVLHAAATIADNLEIGHNEPSNRTPNITGFWTPPQLVPLTPRMQKIFAVDLADPAPSFWAKPNIRRYLILAKCGEAKNVPAIRTLRALIAGVTHTVEMFTN